MDINSNSKALVIHSSKIGTKDIGIVVSPGGSSKYAEQSVLKFLKH